jgi:hypothetical protein
MPGEADDHNLASQASRMRAVSPTGRSDLPAVVSAHNRLLSDYRECLEEASNLPPSPRRQSDGLVRLLVGAHVRKRLEELATIYAQLAHLSSDEARAQLGAWAKPKRDGLVEVATGLPSLRLPGILVAIPLVITVVGPLTRVPWTVYLAFLGGAYVYVGVVFRLFVNSFWRKREILLPGATAVRGLPFEEQEGSGERNVYRSENELFERLGRGKRPEPRLDRWAAALVTAVPILILSIALHHVDLSVNSRGLIEGVLLLIMFAVLGLLNRRPTFRPQRWG